MLVTCTCNVPLVATHSRNQSNNSTSSGTVDGMLRNFWGQGNCTCHIDTSIHFRDKTFEEAVDLLTIEEEKLPRKTKLYTLIKSYSNTKLVQS